MNSKPRKNIEPVRNRAAIGCESLEDRAMLAMYFVAREPDQSIAPARPPVETSLVAAPQALTTEPALLLAFQKLLTDLTAYAEGPRSNAAVQAVNDDLSQIALIVRQPNSPTVQNLTNDVTAIVSAGTFSAAQRTQIGADLAAVFAGAVSQPVFFTANNATTFLGVTTTPGVNLLGFLSNPNALATVFSGQPRGQDTTDATAGAGNFAVLGNSTSPGDPQRAAYGKLITDLRSILGAAPIPQTLRADLFAATTGAASRPDPRAVAALRADTTAVLSSGTFTDAQRAKLTADFAGVLKSAGIAQPVADRIAADARKALDAANVGATDYRTIFEDVTAILKAAPSRPLGGPGGWWFGRPPGL